MKRKILGYLFIALAIPMTLAILGKTIQLLTTLTEMIRALTAGLDAYQMGKVLGVIIYWSIHFSVTFLLWRYGIKWIRAKG